MGEHWDLLIARDDLLKAELTEASPPQLSDGELLLKGSRVGMTANNVTYALTGDDLNYWSFFPADDGWGRVPLWGFADIVESRVPEFQAGERVYGYLPTSSHLVVRPEAVGRSAFADVSEHRANLPTVYNRYALTHKDPSYSVDQEDLQILYRPLFFTSFVLDDFLEDNDYFGAEQIVMSSASSKTAYGTAFCLTLRQTHPKLIALTSARNMDFTTSLGLYDEVVSYDDLESLSANGKTLYVDVAGNHKLRVRIHEHFGDNLVHDSSVGIAHKGRFAQSDASLPGPGPEFFFAPAQIDKRRKDWGPDQVGKRYGLAWKEFAPKLADWVDIMESSGPDGLRAAWLKAVAGELDPKTGLVIAL
jgi:hypothetical protein